MRRPRISCAIGVSLWSAVATGSQRRARRCTARGAAGPPEGRAVRDRHVHQRTAARCPRRAADAVRQPDTRHRRARSRVSGHRRGRQSDAADPAAGRSGVLDRSLPRLLRARRHRPHVAGGAVSLDAGSDSIRVGRYRAGRPQDHRRRSERGPVRSDQGPEQNLVTLRDQVDKRLPTLKPDLPFLIQCDQVR